MRGWQIVVGMIIVFILTSIIFIVRPVKKDQEVKFTYDYIPEKIDVDSDAEGYISNETKLNDFFQRTRNNEKAYIRVIGHSIEGNPFYSDIYYSNHKFDMIQQFTKDPFQTRPFESQTCKGMEVRKNNNQQIEYILTGCSKSGEYTVAWKR